MIHMNGFRGFRGLGDSYGPDTPIEGETLPSSELLMSDSWGSAVAPTLPDPARTTKQRSFEKPPASPSAIATDTFGPPASLMTNPPDGFPAPTTGGEVIFGFIPLPTWLPKWAAYGIGLAALAFAGDYAYRHFIKGVGGRRVVTNPKGRGRGRRARLVGVDDERGLEERAAEFGEKFHWGIKGRKSRRAKVPRTPKVMTKLGEIVNITYKTKKRGESAEFFVHEFGEEGGRRPTLGMDIENKKLHFVGGDYDVTADGIKD